jgi:hypothetical protein
MIYWSCRRLTSFHTNIIPNAQLDDLLTDSPPVECQLLKAMEDANMVA